MGDPDMEPVASGTDNSNNSDTDNSGTDSSVTDNSDRVGNSSVDDGAERPEVNNPVATGTDELGGNATVYIHSELLCFVHWYSQSCSAEKIKRVAVCFYSGEQIIQAKNLLWNSQVKDKLKEFRRRKTTTQRSEEEAHLTDIMEAMDDLDRQRTKVQFYAIDLTKIPKHCPEEINELAILDRLTALERKFNELRNGLSEVNQVPVSQTVQKDPSRKLTSDSTDTVPAVPVPSNEGCTTNSASQEPEMNRVGAQGEASPASNSQIGEEHLNDKQNDNGMTEAQSASGCQSKANVSDKTYAKVASKPACCNHANLPEGWRPKSKTVDDGDEDFQVPRYHRRKSVSVSSNINVFITKVHRDYTCEQLYEYLVNCGVQVRGLYQRSHLESVHKSFVVSVPKSDFSKIDRQELWDEGIEVREYVERKYVERKRTYTGRNRSAY